MSSLLDHWPIWTPFMIGWLLGWMLLARPRPLPAAGRQQANVNVSVVVPARNEAAMLPGLIESLRDQLRDGDELIVVDDGSTDDTGHVAASLGAHTLSLDGPDAGWLGKPAACWAGAGAAHGDIVVFIDADVRADDGLLDRLVGAALTHPDALVSVQPWHVPYGLIEQLGLFGNLAALTATGRFSVVGYRVRPRLAFGPVLAIDRRRYLDAGGHAAASVRGAVLEDVALARSVGRAELFTGRTSASFRMYPGGWRDLADGWTRVLSGGARNAPPVGTFATALWLWALAAAPFVGWWAYAAAIVQVGVLARVAGRFSPLLAVLYPVPLAVFVALTIRSIGVRMGILGAHVRWKGREIASR